MINPLVMVHPNDLMDFRYKTSPLAKPDTHTKAIQPQK